MRRVMLVLCAAGALLAACDKDKASDVKLAPSASSLAPSTAVAGKTFKVVIDPKGTASIDMPAPKLHITASTSASAGSLDIDAANLEGSRGEVKIDLTTLVTTTYKDAQDAKQTGHARCWLEVADCEEGKHAEDVKAVNRYAVYAIRSIANASASDLAKVSPTKDGPDEIRTVTLTTKGELLIHGHKVEREADMEVQFRYAPGAAVDKPRAVELKTKRPLRVTLAEHDVKPRDSLGKIAKNAFNLLGTKVADTADISLVLRAAPQS
jgi:hypothetical protein